MTDAFNRHLLGLIVNPVNHTILADSNPQGASTASHRDHSGRSWLCRERVNPLDDPLPRLHWESVHLP
jgi:hypothetical protein